MSIMQFDDYEIDFEQRRLSERGQPLRLGGRAFDILSALVARAGEVVTKEELIELVWPTTTVDEGSLRVHLVGLRKTLGDRAKHYIETIPGRGYLFVGDVRPVTRGQAQRHPEQDAAADLMGTLPRIPRRLVGRDEFVKAVLEILEGARLLTLAGPGGIGKTSVAVVCAHAVAMNKRVVFLDLAALADGEQLLPSLATQLGLDTFGNDILPGILAELSNQETMLILDSCERVVDTAANIVEIILKASPTTQVLATSREPLRASMERVRQLAPLEYPVYGQDVTDALAYPAVELFVNLAALAGDNIDLTERASINLAAEIVQRLDGIPLAIELAAARLFDMDLPTLHRSVADPIALLRRGRRTAPPRQHTLRATLDWSYSTLSDYEKELLLRLSVFAGTFSPEAALIVAESEDRADAFHEAFDGLFLKSLLVVTQQGGTFRLLGTTRDYARAKLEEAVYARSCRRAHASYCLERLRLAASEWPDADPLGWRANYSDLVHDVRSALLWAFGENGDIELGIRLTAASDALWVQFGLIAEQLEMSERALRSFEELALQDTFIEMKLRMSFGSALYHSKTIARNAEVITEFQKVLEIAAAEDNKTKLTRAVIGIAAIHTSNGDYQSAIDLVEKHKRDFDAITPQASSRLLNHNYHYVGDFDKAMEHAWIALESTSDNTTARPNSGTSYDPRISALCTVVKTHWLQGRFSDARLSLEETLREAVARDHAISTCLYLAVSAIPTAFGLYDEPLGFRLLQTLKDVSTKNSLLRWREWGISYEQVLAARRSNDALSVDRIVKRLKGATFENALVMAGRLINAEALQRIVPRGNWCGAEVLRLSGELAMPRAPSQGRDLLQAGYELAVQQAARTFALRCATSILQFSTPEQSSRSRSRVMQALDAVERDEAVDDVSKAIALL